jgi:hypothetical protein
MRTYSGRWPIYYTHKVVLRVGCVLSLEAERLCHTLQSMKLGSAKLTVELVVGVYGKVLDVEGAPALQLSPSIVICLVNAIVTNSIVQLCRQPHRFRWLS